MFISSVDATGPELLHSCEMLDPQHNQGSPVGSKVAPRTMNPYILAPRASKPYFGNLGHQRATYDLPR
jgi:hypothetical protein